MRPGGKSLTRRRSSPLLRRGRRHMRVKPCARCPYMPQDLTGHYDPDAALHVCAKCDGEQAMLTNHYPRETRRRRKCSTDPNIFRRISSCMKDFMQSGTCPTIPPLAVATRRTATRLRSSTLTATSTQDAERTASTFPFQLKR